ncbi:alpha/beta fold hydrolase [Pseudomonas sp. NPDC007930]|uniref:alpha/beta fold hydrolase n=1 Tax=Pseudomonas sp. NPDC007930 TaxID=3364417 RepID=UPI0036E17577
MRPETAVLDVQGPYRVYTEYYRASAAGAKTIILVNGSLATTASFAQTVRNLQPQFNVVLYDQPYAGKSRPHNSHERLVTKEEESQVLLSLIEHFRAQHLISFSWGGACAMMALAKNPAHIERAAINSFSPVLNGPMRDYLERGVEVLAACDRCAIGHLINDTIGKHLPSLFKRFNYRHVSSLADYEYLQMHSHVSEVLQNHLACALNAAPHIRVPLLFVNGEWDEYTSHQDARQFAPHLRQARFREIPEAGHFLDMEHQGARDHTREALLDFFNEGHVSGHGHYVPHGQAALAV